MTSRLLRLLVLLGVAAWAWGYIREAIEADRAIQYMQASQEWEKGSEANGRHHRHEEQGQE